MKKVFLKLVPSLVALTLLGTLFTPFLVAPPKAYAASNAAATFKAVCLGLGGTAAAGGTEAGTAVSTADRAQGALFVPVTVQNISLGVIAAQGTLTTAQTTAETCGDFAEWLFDILLAALKKRILDMVVDQIIFWVQGGGEPKFVSDWQGFLKDAGDVAAGDFIREIGAGFLCEPFSLQVRLSLTPIRRFTEQITCTLTQVVNNVQNFYNDFRNGGWIAYETSWQPQNNFFGALSLTGFEKLSRAAKAQSAAQSEALAGGGFLSTKSCEERQGPLLPGQTREQAFGPDLDRDGTAGDDPNSCIVVTPGKTIGDLVSKAVGSDIDYIVGADDLSEYLAAIADAVINRLVAEGINGLRGLTTVKKPGGGKFTSGTIAECSGLSSPTYETCVQYALQSRPAGTSAFDLAKQNLLQQIDGSLATRGAANASINASLQQLQSYLASLNNLLNSFSGTSCATAPVYINAINAEMSWASTTHATIFNQKTLNDSIIAQLNNVRPDVQNLAPGAWITLSNILNQLQSSDIANPAAAEFFRFDMQSLNQEISERIVQTLQTFNQNLNSCQSAP